ncbi:kinase-like domain-containing protein [Sporodiniella umbellata]|nr:kinase-like domain-containing protein [Sporodiniella umbellata]
MSKADYWSHENVAKWLDDKGWGRFAQTFEKYGICHEKFLDISLAELVEYLPRSMTTYYERRRLLCEIRALIPSNQTTANAPIHISINTNVHNCRPNLSPRFHSSDHVKGYSSSSPSPTPSPNSDHLITVPFTTRKNYSSYSPKAAFNKFKNTFRSTAATQNSALSLNGPVSSPRSVRHESGDECKAAVDKASRFWSNYWHHSHKKSPSQPSQHKENRIQITGDQETWYGLNVTNINDPSIVKQNILNRMCYFGGPDDYLYYHENGSNPSTPIDSQELMYICSNADNSASQRIFVRPVNKQGKYISFSALELGESPTCELTKRQTGPLGSRQSHLCRKAAIRPVRSSMGIKLTDPPTPPDELKKAGASSLPPSPIKSHFIDEPLQQTILWAVPPNQTSFDLPVPTTPESDEKAKKQLLETPVNFWGERPPTEVVFENLESYFDKQDLDKEILVDADCSLYRRGTLTKSIRLVAREASRKYKTNPKELVRRKSTKLWGKRVIEVKPTQTKLPSVNEKASLYYGDASSKKPIQWIRGKMIGKGSFGKVYLAFNLDTGEVIAVKQVELPITASDLRDERQKAVVDSLNQEIVMLKDLDHENIVQYLGYGKDDGEGMINIFLEYVSGGSLASRLAVQGAFDEKLTQYFTKQICSGLAYLHSRKILHRDIKAANILIEEDGICKISDFGLSKKNDYDGVYDQNSRMSLRGSVYWMAPEVVKNEPYSAKVDIWSLGCTVLELLTGQRPWISLNQIAAIYNLGRLNTPNIPDYLSDCAKDFLRKCFTIDPTHRPTAEQLLTHQFLNIDSLFQFKEYLEKGKI